MFLSSAILPFPPVERLTSGDTCCALQYGIFMTALKIILSRLLIPCYTVIPSKPTLYCQVSNKNCICFTVLVIYTLYCVYMSIISWSRVDSTVCHCWVVGGLLTGQKFQALWPNEDTLSHWVVWIQSGVLPNYLYAVPSNSCLGDCTALNQYPVNFRLHSDPPAAAHTYRPPLWRENCRQAEHLLKPREQIRTLDKPSDALNINDQGLACLLFLYWQLIFSV